MRFRVIESSSGFRIERPHRCPVTIRLAPWAFVVNVEGRAPERVGLCEYDRLVDSTSRMLIQRWLRPPHVTGPAAGKKRISRSQICEAIEPAVRCQWKRLLAKADPAVVAVQDAVFGATGEHAFLAEEEALYREGYLVRDVLKYRAAAIALVHIESELWPEFYRRTVAPDVRQLEAGWLDTASPNALIYAMRRWCDLFSSSGTAYRSLNRTLMNLPGGIRPALVCRLQKLRLKRPMVSGLELTTLLLKPDVPGPRDPEASALLLNMLHHATEAEIHRTIARIAAHTGRTLSPSRESHIRFVLRFLVDYPEPHRGGLSGLADKAVRWHRDAARRTVDELGAADTPTAYPPIPLPAVEGITFLRTIGDLAEEGERMQHCIASYAGAAIAGETFLFHAEYEGQHASIEVAACGDVRQAVGPRNSRNAAATWGAQHLHLWAHPLRLRAGRIEELP